MPRAVEFVFGTPQEIDLRGDDAAMAGPERFMPENTPTSFKQIAGRESTQGQQSVNRARLQRSRGNDPFKWSGGVGKP